MGVFRKRRKEAHVKKSWESSNCGYSLGKLRGEERAVVKSFCDFPMFFELQQTPLFRCFQ